MNSTAAMIDSLRARLAEHAKTYVRELGAVQAELVVLHGMIEKERKAIALSHDLQFKQSNLQEVEAELPDDAGKELDKKIKDKINDVFKDFRKKQPDK